MSAMPSSETDWSPSILEAVSQFGTPCYLFSWPIVLEALDVLTSLDCGIPIRHWLSMKSQPLRYLLREWRKLGLGVEVVSEFELRAALEQGFQPDSILVNGVAKHHWLSNIQIQGLRVHFDSLREARHLTTISATRKWRVGIRFALKEQFDPDEPIFGSQFGMSFSEARHAVAELRRMGIEPESAHFHLRSNVHDPAQYARALEDLLVGCQYADLTPRFLDCGGGLPCPGDDLRRDAHHSFSLSHFAGVLFQAAKTFETVEQVWLENGRFVTSRAGFLILRILDIKERPECRYLVCDGGRTNHALVSDWELHAIFSIPHRSGPSRLTTICGPTCMAYDRLARIELPSDLDVGDLIVWKNAGAYHIPWETRFSHGLAAVIWVDPDGQLVLARQRQTFAEWWDLL
jgi:diaminopimelate decarboxylase